MHSAGAVKMTPMKKDRDNPPDKKPYKGSYTEKEVEIGIVTLGYPTPLTAPRALLMSYVRAYHEVLEIPRDHLPLHINDPNEDKRKLILWRMKIRR